MRKPWFWAAFTASLTAAGAAHADETGVEIGVRSGYAIPLGNAAADTDLDEFYSGVIPLWFDLGYRLTPNVMIGGYFQYGFGLVPDQFEGACDLDAVDCSFSNVRLGAQVHYHFRPWESVDPWLGGGIGYEWAHWSVSGTLPLVGNVGADATIHGFEFLNLQAGVDFLPSDDANFALGPFLSLSLAQYSSGTVQAGEGESSADIDDKSLHEWLTLGVRGTFVP